MEAWQKKCLTINRVKLMEETICNELIFAHLLSQGVLAKVDVERVKRSNGRYEQAGALYDLVETRENGFVETARALAKVNQTGPYAVFIDAFARHVIPNVKVNFLEKTLSVNEWFLESEIGKIIGNMRTHLTLEQYIDLYDKFRNSTPVKLLCNSIPEKISFYVSRSMSRRVKVNPELFKINCPDVFVFKQIKYSALKTLVQPHPVGFSSNQTILLSDRFIVLEHADDWKEICKNANVPVHLLKNEEQNYIIMEATTGNSTVIHKYLEYKQASKNQTEKMSILEEEFFETVSKDGAPGVCICDNPGMGKSLLLANFARSMKQQHGCELFDQLYGSKEVQLSSVLSVGILQREHSDGRGSFQFAHRTFAEYLAAECFANLLYDETIERKLTKKLLRFLFEKVIRALSQKWQYPVIMHFMNSALTGKTISAKNQLLFKIFASSVSWERLYKILKATICQNHVNVFLLMMQLLVKMNGVCLQSFKAMIYSTKYLESVQPNHLCSLLAAAVNYKKIAYHRASFPVVQ